MNYIDFHCDTLYRLFYSINTLENETLWRNNGHLDLSRLVDHGYFAQFFACFVDRKTPSTFSNHYEDCRGMIQLLKDSLQHVPNISLAFSGKDYFRYKSQHQLSCFLTVEDGGILDGTLDRLHTLYHEGIRLITLTWNYENSLGYPHNMSHISGTGLKPFGIEAIKEMERLHILIDTSHLSDEGFNDVYHHTRAPFIASHSCCRSLCNHSRNLTDEMIHHIGERQGLIGLNFYGMFLENDGQSSVESLARHLRHIIHTGGLDVAALGTDFDGINYTTDIGGVQDMHKLIPALEMAGFLPSEIDAICYKNAERILALM